MPCLLEHVVTYFNVYTKLGFVEEAKFDFFYNSWKYLINFFFID